MISLTDQIMSDNFASCRTSLFSDKVIMASPKSLFNGNGFIGEIGADWSKPFAVSQGLPVFLADPHVLWDLACQLVYGSAYQPLGPNGVSIVSIVSCEVFLAIF